jgi:hypothetical protein
MTNAKSTDCVLFINEDMARLVIAWGRLRSNGSWTPISGNELIAIPEINASYSPKQLADVLGISAGQVKSMIRQAVAVGIFEMNGEVSELAQKCVNGIIAKKVQEFK